MENATPASVAICGGVPISSCTNTVTTGCTVRTPNCAISSTKNNAISAPEPVSSARVPRMDLARAEGLGGVKSSWTKNQTIARVPNVAAAVQKNGAR